jgi:hypothetical protein
MANDLTGNTWKIDTASATPIITQDVYINSIRWIGATTAGHEAKITDNNGASPDIKYSAFADGANFIDEKNYVGAPANSRCVGGIIVPTLGSGILYIDIA